MCISQLRQLMWYKILPTWTVFQFSKGAFIFSLLPLWFNMNAIFFKSKRINYCKSERKVLKKTTNLQISVNIYNGQKEFQIYEGQNQILHFVCFQWFQILKFLDITIIINNQSWFLYYKWKIKEQLDWLYNIKRLIRFIWDFNLKKCTN